MVGEKTAQKLSRNYKPPETRKSVTYLPVRWQTSWKILVQVKPSKNAGLPNCSTSILVLLVCTASLQRCSYLEAKQKFLVISVTIIARSPSHVGQEQNKKPTVITEKLNRPFLCLPEAFYNLDICHQTLSCLSH